MAQVAPGRRCWKRPRPGPRATHRDRSSGRRAHRRAGRLKEAAYGSFTAFSGIVARCQRDGVLPDIDTVSLTGLIYAALHGVIDLEIGGRASGAKELGSVKATAGLLFDLLKASVTSSNHNARIRNSELSTDSEVSQSATGL